MRSTSSCVVLRILRRVARVIPLRVAWATQHGQNIRRIAQVARIRQRGIVLEGPMTPSSVERAVRV